MKETKKDRKITTKFRPGSFDEVIGHDAHIESLQEVLKAGESQCFVFAGPSGVGKTTLARIIAKEVECDDRNILEINGSDATGVDAMRELISSLKYNSLGTSNIRVIIIDECQKLSSNAWDSLLKPTEEPAEGTYWIFCTTELNKVRKAIINRSQLFQLEPVRPKLIFNLLKKVAKAQGYEASKEVMEFLAKKSKGSPRQALGNLATCKKVTDVDKAASLIAEIGEANDDMKELAYGLIRQSLSWTDAMKLCRELKSYDSESIRRTIIAIASGFALNTKSAQQAAGGALPVLEAFGQPYPGNSGIGPVIASIGDLMNA